MAEFEFGKWYPIETAQKPTKDIDLWVVKFEIDGKGKRIADKGRRYADCSWGMGVDAKRSGWLDSGNRFIEETMSAGRLIVTHWMPGPLPPPPDAEGKGERE